MTYFGILGAFIVPPILVLLAVAVIHAQRTGRFDRWPLLAVGGHILLAVAYTTPWDNYLVATSVWWYDPALVTGITLGWVPIEEYTFFVLQTILTGLWTVALLRTAALDPGQRPVQPRRGLRRVSIAVLAVVWLISTVVLFAGWMPGRYGTLILSWALLPIMLQVAFGADILLANARLLLLSIGLPTLYLWAVDMIAIAAGTWTIDPAQTTGLKLGPLPVEEMLFFLVTNVLIGFGVTLLRAPASHARLRQMQDWLRARRGQPVQEEPSPSA